MLRVQVVMKEEERAHFRLAASHEGLSLSAWMKKAANERLKAEAALKKLQSTEALDAFFRCCDEHEIEQEPDWQEHLAHLLHSRTQGIAQP